jgi:ribosomal protein S11
MFNNRFDIIVKSTYKNSQFFLYENLKLLKQWSIKAKQYKKSDKRKNTKYNLNELVYDMKGYIKGKDISYINLIFIGIRGISRRYFLTFLLENNKNLKILKIINKTKTPFNGCRPKKKKRK